MKVTDRRLFTNDGELRDEYRHLKDAKVPEVTARPVEPAATTPPQAPAKTEVPPLPVVKGYPEPDPQGPSFFDLVGMIAEPASIYLREASMGRSGELRAAAQQDQNLQLARLHIDLLAILREKTAPELPSQELVMLDDLIGRLRAGFVQVQG